MGAAPAHMATTRDSQTIVTGRVLSESSLHITSELFSIGEEFLGALYLLSPFPPTPTRDVDLQ